MNGKAGAILLDTRSIQRYVFSSNKLKTNTGASYLVDGIFNDAMMPVLESFHLKMPADKWQESTGVQMRVDESVECEIAYIGGGNMLILVRKDGDVLALCREIVAKWSEKILLMAPGLKTGAAIGYVDLSDEGFQDSLNELYKQLKYNQNNILPQVDLPYTGLTLECDYSGKTADAFIYDEISGERRAVAAEIKAKLTAFEYAEDELREEYKDL